ncbi:hypothetical protein ACET9V_16870 [Aeromonas caviae]|uniref:hypothetical protein n=1 Tax=Aeromonas caviae TaxID=648 RepID=UPI0038CFA3E0
MPVITDSLPLLPAKLDPALLAPGYFPHYHALMARINTEPSTYTDVSVLAAEVDAVQDKLDAMQVRVAPAPQTYAGNKNSGYRRLLSSLMAAWLVQQEAVKNIFPTFWVYALYKVQGQADLVAYIEHTLSQEYRTCQVYAAFVRDAERDVRYFLQVQYAPQL